MKFPALKFIFAVFLSISSTTSIAATLFNRADFGANAVEFGFDTFDGDLNPGDGNFSAQLGRVRRLVDFGFSDEGITEPLIYKGFSNHMDFTFNDPVSAFGFNFAFGKDDTYIFSIADSINNIIGSVTLNPTDFGSCTSTTSLACGFIGLNVDSNQISSAVLRLTTASIIGPLIDNVIYET